MRRTIATSEAYPISGRARLGAATLPPVRAPALTAPVSIPGLHLPRAFAHKAAANGRPNIKSPVNKSPVFQSPIIKRPLVVHPAPPPQQALPQPQLQIDSENEALLLAQGVLTEGQDAKSALNQFVQRYIKRPVTKQDILYTTEKYDEGYQSVVRIECMESQEFAGEVCPNLKSAEKEAAAEALKAFTPLMWEMPTQGCKTKKRKAESPSPAIKPPEVKAPKILPMATDLPEEFTTPAAQTEPNTNNLAAVAAAAAASQTFKSDLNAVCMKILRRVMAKGELVYETNAVVGGFQSVVTVACLGDEHVYAGEVSQQKREAEQSAAQMALDALLADNDIAMAIYAPKPQKGQWRQTEHFGGRPR